MTTPRLWATPAYWDELPPPPALKLKHHYAAINISDELMSLYHAFPQRVMAGIPTDQESPLTNQFKSVYGGTLNIKTEVGSAVLAINDNHFTVKSADLPQIAGKMLAADNRVPLVGKGILGGRVTLKAGYGDEEGRVYAAESDAQAARNLNFALANLAAYNEWHTVTKPAKEKAEKEAKAKAEREKSEEAVRAARLKNGLDLYNKVNGVRYVSWPAFVTHTARELWAKQAEEVNALSRKSNPYTTSIFNSGGIFNAHTISANAINRDYFRI